jgi:peptidoglycan/LPS O-acetylase OafA/YrhL
LDFYFSRQDTTGSSILFPPGHYWFLYILFFCHVAGAALILLKSQALILLIGVLAYLGSFWDPVEQGNLLKPTTRHFLFYAIGLVASIELFGLVGRFSGLRRIHGIRVPLLIVAAAATVTLASLNFAMGAPYYSPGTLLTAIVGVIAVVVLSTFPWFSASSVLLFIGRHTMPIFLLHVFFTAGTRIVAKNLVGITEPSTLVALCTMAGILGPVLVFVAAERLGVTRFLLLRT